jgi:hypothetical protein
MSLRYMIAARLHTGRQRPARRESGGYGREGELWRWGNGELPMWMTMDAIDSLRLTSLATTLRRWWNETPDSAPEQPVPVPVAEPEADLWLAASDAATAGWGQTLRMALLMSIRYKRKISAGLITGVVTIVTTGVVEALRHLH